MVQTDPLVQTDAKPKPSAAGRPLVRPPRRGAWVALIALSFLYVLNFLDRQLLSILAKPIQDSLHITDGQLGLLGGLYFALFYCLIAIPVGWLADRTHRIGVLAVACGIWSAATIACGLARGFGDFAMARMAVGFGEAGGAPPSYAILTDYFPPERRGMALALYNLALPIGAGIGIALGAAVTLTLSWRHAFLIVGAVGLIAAVIVALVVKEPPRGGLDGNVLANVPRAGFWSTLKTFFGRPVLLLTALGGGATQFITYGLGNFATLFLMREKGMSLADAAIWYALVVVLAMGGGIFASGWAVDRFTRITRAAYGYIPAVALVLALPFFCAFIWAPTWPLALAFLFGPTFLNSLYLSSSIALVHAEVRPDQRVMSGALLLLVMNLIGLGLGPTYVGAASDFFAATQPDRPLQLALYTLIPAYGVAIALYLALARRLRKPKDAASTPA